MKRLDLDFKGRFSRKYGALAAAIFLLAALAITAYGTNGSVNLDLDINNQAVNESNVTDSSNSSLNKTDYYSNESKVCLSPNSTEPVNNNSCDAVNASG